MPPEQLEGDRRGAFEEGRRALQRAVADQTVDRAPDGGGSVPEIPRHDLSFEKDEPFLDALEMGRGIAPDPVAGGMQRRRGHRGDGALAVGAADDERSELLLGMAECGAQRIHFKLSRASIVQADRWR